MRHIAICGLYMFLSSSATALSSNLAMNARKMNSILLSRPQMDKLMVHIHELNNAKDVNSLLPLVLENEVLGYVTGAFSENLREYEDIFDFKRLEGKLSFTEQVEKLDMNARTKLFNQVNTNLRDQGLIYGWRDELLPVLTSYSSPPRLLIERAACPYYGVKAYGVHMNGFVRKGSSTVTSTGDITHLWVAKRAATKSTWPGMLDHIVAGGQPYGIDVMGNVIKECDEEASIPPELAKNAVCTGAVSYNCLDGNGNLKRDALFCFDLELPPDFTPAPQDGEVESFQLQEISWVLEKVIEGGPTGYKPNCNLVLIDFFIRHGIINPESPRFLELVAGLRGYQCS